MIPRYGLAGVTAFLVAALVLPIVHAVAVKCKLYDQPGELKIHERPIVRLGGIAIACGLIAGILFSGSRHDNWAMFLVALSLLWFVSLIDDLFGLAPITRFCAQTISALILWQAGWRIRLVGIAAVDAVIAILFVVLMVNSFNMLDGMDGLAAGVGIIIALGYIPICAHTGTNRGIVLAASLGGAALAFLILNFPPARIFMGDSGSTVLGFVLAAVTLNVVAGQTRAAMLPLIAPALFVAVPLADALFAIVRRLRNRRSPFVGDRSHFYDLLLKRGWSTRQVALFSYAVTGVLVMLGVLQSHLLHL
jgi:UDP-GlcNAc:undecaprenyl-phosphate/decaprenyl-phosphate GlcNAc-1-phosphate transferase